MQNIIENYLNNPNIEYYLKEQVNQMDEIELSNSFNNSLQFGTAGIRGIMGPGPNKMNIYTIRHVTLGLANYLLKEYPNQQLSVAIGYDSRNYSVEFSQNIISVLSSLNIKAYVYDQVKPTPLLSYAVRHFNCHAGIMITASHNPKEYNGYKVYNQTGCQINLDVANKISNEMKLIENIYDYPVLDFFKIKDSSLIEYINEDIDDIYLKDIEDIILNNPEEKKSKVVFSPLHGTSGKIVPKALNYFGYHNLVLVKEQMVVDGNFPDAPSMNPEELASFDLAKKYAIENNSDLIIVNDPDADRLGVMYLDNNNNYQVLTGNQTGALLLDYIINQKKLTGSEVVYNTIVTGELGNQIVKQSGIKLEQTLTGFKFIGEKIAKLENKEDFMFGYEESYGYLINSCVRDKDAIQAVISVVEMVNFYLNKKINIGDKLNQLYHIYGHFIEETKSINLQQEGSKEKINSIFNKYQNIKEVAGIEVIKVEDYSLGINGLPKEKVLKIYLKDYGWFAIRPSGTEPKLKLYFSIKVNQDNNINIEYDTIVQCIEKEIA